MVELNYQEIGKRIKEKRKNCKITQSALAELIDVSPSYISEIECGNSITSIATMVNIADALDTSVEYLILGITKFNSENEFSKILSTIPVENRELYINLCKKIAEPLM